VNFRKPTIGGEGTFFAIKDIDEEFRGECGRGDFGFGGKGEIMCSDEIFD
jgi:hypothetical protein